MAVEERGAEGAEETIEEKPEAGAEAEGASAPDEGDEQPGGDDSEDSPYAPLAKELGWVPKDQFTGPADQWKDPETFIRDGRNIQRETSRELKSVRQQLDTIAKTNAVIVEQTVRERVRDLAAEYQRAIDDGDPSQAYRLANEIGSLTSQIGPQAQQHPQGPSPEAQNFAERNASWFNKPGYEYATSRAVEICNSLAAQGYSDHGQQLAIAEQRLKQEMPQLFKPQANGKAPPGVNRPAARTAGSGSRGKTFTDMPPEAQRVARDMEERGLIKKEAYAEKYFAMQAGKA